MKKRYAQLHIRRYLIAGILMLTPLWVTWLVLDFLFTQLSRMGRPWVHAFTNAIDKIAPGAAAFLWDTWIESAVAALLTLFLLYAIGWATSRVLARQVIARIEGLVARIPLVQVIYGSTKKLLAALQTKPDRVQRVVLIDFPAAPLKTVALVTRVVKDTRTGRDMAIVYVPTSPNPTSGYMEIIPVDHITPTDWTLDEAMRFVITGGTSAPDRIDFGSLPPVRTQDYPLEARVETS
jgi:uncharacterized membrane protein